MALVDAVASIEDLATRPLIDSVAAISVGIVAGQAVLDLDYTEDVAAEVDMNVVMTGSGRFVEVQGTGEEATFSDESLAAMLKLARSAGGDPRDAKADLGRRMAISLAAATAVQKRDGLRSSQPNICPRPTASKALESAGSRASRADCRQRAR